MTNIPHDPAQEPLNVLPDSAPPPPLPPDSPPFGGGAVGLSPQPPRKSRKFDLSMYAADIFEDAQDTADETNYEDEL